MLRAQDLFDLVIFEGVPTATFVGYECLLVGSSGRLAPAGGLRAADRLIAGSASFRVCHASSPTLSVQVPGNKARASNDRAVTAWPASGQHARPEGARLEPNQRWSPSGPGSP